MLNDELLKQLDLALSDIRPSFRHSKLYKILKSRLSDAGYWRAQQRGNPSAGYRAMISKVNNNE